jgi:hypothetical protein
MQVNKVLPAPVSVPVMNISFPCMRWLVPSHVEHGELISSHSNDQGPKDACVLIDARFDENLEGVAAVGDVALQ